MTLKPSGPWGLATNTALKERARQFSAENRTLDERLNAARSNLRFQDPRFTDLETQLANPPLKRLCE